MSAPPPQPTGPYRRAEPAAPRPRARASLTRSLLYAWAIVLVISLLRLASRPGQTDPVLALLFAICGAAGVVRARRMARFDVDGT